VIERPRVQKIRKRSSFFSETHEFSKANVGSNVLPGERLFLEKSGAEAIRGVTAAVAA
jgi:hypothetical protein